MENKSKFLLSNRLIITLLVVIVLSGGFFADLYAQKTFSGASGGNWSLATNWTPSGVPTATDDVTIPNNKSITIDIAANCRNFTINRGGKSSTITIGANSLTATGAVIIRAPLGNGSITKQITISTGFLSCASIAIANPALPTQSCSIAITSSGTMTVTGNITMAGTSVVNNLYLDNGGTLNIGGYLSGGGFSSTNNNSTINFNGTTAQLIPMNGSYIYNMVKINNIAGATLEANVSTSRVTDNITVETGILNNGGFAIAGNTGKTFTVMNGATFRVSGTTSSFPSGFSTNTLGATSTVEYSGTGNQTIFDVASPGYGHLILSAGGTKTAASGLDIQGNVTINGGPTFVGSTFTHNVGGNWLNNGMFTAGTGTINFNSTTTGKTISGTLAGVTGKFYNLTFNGVGGGWTIGSSMDVANTLTITNGDVSMNGVLTLETASGLPAIGGTLTLENNASLIQSGYSGANTGNIIVKRNSTPIVLDDYTYWSSPTTGTQTLFDFSPTTQLDKFFIYNNAWIYADPFANTFTKGIGYAIRSPEGVSTTVPAPFAHQFTGVPNNGDVDVALTVGPGPEFSGRVIGNPYPSAIDADAFIYANTVGFGTINQTISGTLYFWTHNHGLFGNNYLASDYAHRNLSGGTAVDTGTGNTTAPTQFIASGQGFFIRTDANGNVSFRNDMRIGPNNENFYKYFNKTTAVPVLERHRIWLNLTNGSKGFRQALLGYIESATNGFDAGFDGLYFGDNQYALYSLIDNKRYAIQAKALPFTDSDIVPIGYKINVSGNATISIDSVDGLFLDNQNIYLEDQLLGITHDLKGTPYTFPSEAGTFDNRFLLRFINSPLDSEFLDDLSNSVIAASKNKEITIKSKIELIEQVTVYDILGRKIYQNNKVDSNEVLITDLKANQALIIKIILFNGQSVNKKLVY